MCAARILSVNAPHPVVRYLSLIGGPATINPTQKTISVCVGLKNKIFLPKLISAQTNEFWRNLLSGAGRWRFIWNWFKIDHLERGTVWLAQQKIFYSRPIP
jgi:hypothetical protein